MTDTQFDRLWGAQLALYPNSEVTPGTDLAEWVLEPGISPEQKKGRALCVMLALQYPEGVWYRTEAPDKPADSYTPEGGHIGFRYGVEPHEYFSGFTHL